MKIIFHRWRRTKKKERKSRERKENSGFKSSEFVNRNVKINRCKCDMRKVNSQCVKINENMLKSRSSEEVKKVTKKKLLLNVCECV